LARPELLNRADARRALDLITGELARRALAAVVAVADDHGELIALERMDGAPLSSITIAMNKACTAARERKSSFDVGRAARHPETGFDIGYYGDPRFVGWGGECPLRLTAWSSAQSQSAARPKRWTWSWRHWPLRPSSSREREGIK
jgi:glc operon protein GlcG